MTARRTWPSFSPLSSQGLFAQRALLQHCHKLKAWDLASQAWLCALLPRGTLVRNTSTGEVTVSLGPVGSLAALAWPVEHKHLKKGFRLYLLGGSNHMSKMPWLVVLELDSYEVLPSKVVAPVQAFLLQGRSVSGPTGLCLQQIGIPMSMLSFAAGHAFWDWDKVLLERLATFEGGGCGPACNSLLLVCGFDHQHPWCIEPGRTGSDLG